MHTTTCKVFNIINESPDEPLELQYTPCSNGIASGYTVVSGTITMCSYVEPYITSGSGSVKRIHDAELKGIGEPQS
jgi:hypothetical protein|tara:strand:- start:128 stop:355 length:228 start_codon:yes stop_codon:yes gene_type:complete